VKKNIPSVFECGILFSKKVKNSFQIRPFELDYALSIDWLYPFKVSIGLSLISDISSWKLYEISSGVILNNSCLVLCKIERT